MSAVPVGKIIEVIRYRCLEKDDLLLVQVPAEFSTQRLLDDGRPARCLTRRHEGVQIGNEFVRQPDRDLRGHSLMLPRWYAEW